jgi:hypothetical protein
MALKVHVVIPSLQLWAECEVDFPFFRTHFLAESFVSTTNDEELY